MSGDSQNLPEFYDDITQLTSGLVAITRWLKGHSQFKELHLGYLGLGTGAAMAFKAAAELQMYIEGIIAVSGRGDLALKEMKLVQCPSLLIAGEFDFKKVNINQHAINYLKGSKQLVIIPKATQLFEEKDNQEELSHIVTTWSGKHMNHKKSVAML